MDRINRINNKRERRLTVLTSSLPPVNPVYSSLRRRALVAFDPRGDVFDDLARDVAGLSIVGLARGAFAFEEGVVEFGVALEGSVFAAGEGALPVGEGVGRHVIVALGVEDEDRAL
jgi:hypothetical protein